MFCDIKSQKGIVRPAAGFLTCVDNMDVNGRGLVVPAIHHHHPKSKLSMPSTQVHNLAAFLRHHAHLKFIYYPVVDAATITFDLNL